MGEQVNKSMPYNNKDIIYLIKNLAEQETALDMLLEFEKTMDQAGMFAYKNWELGELVDGPHVDRYWITTTWMYPKKLMPDPQAGLRLLKYDCKVQFVEDHYIEIERVLGPENLQPDVDQNKKAKSKKLPVWLVTISMPRRFVDDSYEGVFQISGEEIDISDIQAAWDDEVSEATGEDEDTEDQTAQEPDDEFGSEF